MPIDDDTPVGDLMAALGVFRTSQWAHFVLVPLASLGRADLMDGRDGWRAVLGVAVTAAALGYGYAINAIVDRGTDASSEKNPLVGLARVPWTTGAVVAASAALAVMAALPLGWGGLGWCLLSLAASTLYSAGPRAKAYPILGLAANTLIFVPLLFLCAPGSHPGLAAVATTFVSLLVQNQLLHELADSDEDVRGGDLTTGRLLGRVGVRVVCVVVAAVGAVGAWLVAPDRITGAAAAATLVAATLLSLLVEEPHSARRTHRRVAALGGAATYLIRFFA